MKSRAFFISILLLMLGAVGGTAAGPEAESRHGRLVLCLDGTQNNAEQAVISDGPYNLYKPTNVLKTFRAIRPLAGGVSQIGYYSEGVGSLVGEPDRFASLEVAVDRIQGGAFGVGYEARVKDAYRFLLANYQPGDEIIVFGFSRGAAEAQTLARFIEWMGGVLNQEGQGGLLQKQDEYYIPELYEGFRNSKPVSGKQPVEARTVFNRIRERRHEQAIECPQAVRERRQEAIACPHPVQIEFLGVYDTVLSVGSRLAPDGTVTTVDQAHAYLVDRTAPTIVKTVRQALAIDERRWDFRPQVWQPDPEKPTPGQSLQQLWFPGVHSNVGGGYFYDDLADNALEWMLAEAKTYAHLALDDEYLHHFYGPDKPHCYDPSRPNSDTGWAKFVDLIRFKNGRGVRDLELWDKEDSWKRSGLGFHKSLGELLINDCTYRPRNLLEFLARPDRSDRLALFPADQRTEIGKIVKEFRQKPPKPYHCKLLPLPACGTS